MGDWRVATLDSVVELRRGFDLPISERRPGAVPVLSAGSVAGWHDTAAVAGPGVVVGRATNLGRPTWSDIDFWPLNTTLYVANFKGNSPRWVFHLFESLDLTRFDSGSVQPMLNRNYIAKVPVSLPSRGTQDAVAGVLGAIDDKIAANSRLAATADALALSLVAASPVATVPLGGVATQTRRSVAPEQMADEVVAHYSLPAFDAGSGPEMVAPSTIKSSKFVVQRPSVLVSKLNPRFPRVWDIPTVPEVPALASTEFVVLEPVVCSSTVLWALTSQPRFGAALEGMVAGTSGSHQRVKPADMLAVAVPDPRAIASSICDRIDALGSVAARARAQTVDLTALRDVLLPQLMSGRITVREAEEVAGL